MDLLVDRVPAARKLTRAVRELQRAVAAQLDDKGHWIEYADTRLTLSGVREQFAFNLGVEIGIISGRAGDIGGCLAPGQRTLDERAMRLAARGLILQHDVPLERRLLVFLEMVWALAGGPPRRNLGAVVRAAKSRAA